MIRAAESALSIYLHIPFCEKKCVYCDFYSIENLSLRSEFVSLLLDEIDIKLRIHPELRDRRVDTIFFGGGTPSLLEPSELEKILARLHQYFAISSSCELTLECNPGTVTIEKLRGYHDLGVNRLSFGVQSFNASELEFLGRIHNAAQADEAVSMARTAGFQNLSIDLIFALPNQQLETLDITIERALALRTEHISAYNLIVEHGTPLYRLVQAHAVIELDSDRAAVLFEHVQRRLAESGYEQYEISNYARTADLRAKHNMAYWDGWKDYVSFGPSAHEFIAGRRAWNVSSLERYAESIRMGKLPIVASELLELPERRTEILYLQLRSTGIRLKEFYEIFGEDLLENADVVGFIADGLMAHDPDCLHLTQRGYRFCDGIVTALMRTADASAQTSYVIM